MNTDEALALLRKLIDESRKILVLSPNWSTAIGTCWDVLILNDGNPYDEENRDRDILSREPTIAEAVESAKAKLIELGLYEE